MKITDTPATEKIIVVYEDGSTKELTKSAAFDFEEKEDEFNLVAYMVGMEGKDLEMLVSGILQLGINLGMFNHQEEAI